MKGLYQKSVIPRLTRDPLKKITNNQGFARQAHNDILAEKTLNTAPLYFYFTRLLKTFSD